MIERLHLVDGTFELYRAHYSKRPSHTARGRDRKATVGLCASMLWLMREAEEKVTHLAIAFDNPIASFRNGLFDGYKSDEGVPPELRAQFDVVEDACRVLGMCVWSMRDFEADDAIATACVKYGDDVTEVRMLTPDKDMGQCLNGTRVVQVDRIRKRIIREVEFRGRRGIAPESLPDYLALVGDPQDGIPGLKGWGEKGAAAVLAEYKHLENIPGDAGTWRPKVSRAEFLSKTLTENREAALLYRTLATLRRDVPLRESLDDLRVKPIPRAPFEALKAELESTSLNGEGLLAE